VHLVAINLRRVTGRDVAEGEYMLETVVKIVDLVTMPYGVMHLRMGSFLG
jgi:uncharacterized membrane protein YccF (DUF307 family)